MTNWADSHIRAHRQKRFSFKVLGMLLLAFALAAWCAYLGLNGEGW